MADYTYRVKIGDAEYEVVAPDENTAWVWANQVHREGSQKPPKQTPPADEDSYLTRAVKRGVPAIQKGLADLLADAPEALAEFATLGSSSLPSVGKQFIQGLGKLAGSSETYKGLTGETVQGLRTGAEQRLQEIGPREYGGFFEEEGVGRKFGSLTETLAESALPVGAGLATGLVTRSPLAAGAVMGVGNVPMTYGSIRDRQRAEGIDDVQSAVYGTIASSALDVLTGVGGKVLDATAVAAARQLLEGGLKAAATRVGKAGLEESGTEMLQNVVEQVAGGSDPTTKQAMLETLEAGLVGALGGTAFTATGEVVTAPFRGRQPAESDIDAADPRVRAEFQRLAIEEVAAVMAANPGIDQAAAVAQVEAKAEELLTQAVVNVLGEGEADVSTGLDDTGGLGTSIVPTGEPASTASDATELGAAIEGGLGGPVPSVPVSDVGAGAGVSPLAAPTAAQVKATVPTIEQAFADNAIDFEDNYGVKTLNAEQKKQAARIVIQSPEVDPYDAITSIIERGQLLRGEKPAAKVETVAPEPVFPIVDTTVVPAEETVTPPTPATRTMNDMAGVGTVNPENTNEVLVEGGGVQLTPVADDVLQLDSLRAVEKGGGRKAMEQLVAAADENGTTLQLTPEPFAAEAGKEMSPTELTEWYRGFGFQEQPDGSMVRPAVTPEDTSIMAEPAATPQQVLENIDDFARTEAQDRDLDPDMFINGVADIRKGRSPLDIFEFAEQFGFTAPGKKLKFSIEDRPVDAAYDAYKAGTQFAQDRIAEAQTAPTQAEGTAAAKAEKEKFLSRMKKAPGKTARQKLIAIMAEGQEADLKGKSPEEIAEAFNISPLDPEYEEIVGRAGVNRQRIVQGQINKYKGDPSTMTGVVAKELLQNSHDATRASMANGQIEQGRVDFRVSEDGRTITIQDNGQGMTGEILAGPFLEIGSTGKGEGQHSGGFGLAKALLLYSSDKIDVITARDGKVSTLDTSGEKLADAAYTDDTSLQPRIKVRDFTPEDYSLFPDGHGTIVQLRMPEKDLDPRTGEIVHVTQLPAVFSRWDNLLDSMVSSPLFANTYVTYNGDTVPIGANFPLQDFKLFSRVGLPFGTAYVYVSREQKKYSWDRKLHILSDGVWQFDTEIRGIDDEKLPYEIYINIIPSENIKPDSALYPFNEQRKNFSDGGQKSFGKLASLLRATFGVQSFMDEVKSFGNIQYYDPVTGVPGEPIDLTPEIPQDVIDRIERSAAGDDSDIQIGDNGRVVVNGNEIDTDNIDDLQSQLPKSSELIIDQSKVDPTRVMLHDAADVEYEDPNTGEIVRKPIVDYMREKFGSRVDGFFFLVGSKFDELRNEVVKVMDERFPGQYDDLLREAIGISLDPRYRGVSTKVPFSGMFLNPLVPESLDPFERLQGIVTTMYHELAHYKVRNHNAAFPAEMQRITAALKAAKYKQGFDFDKWIDEFVLDILNNGYGDIIDAGQYLFATNKDRESNAYSYSDPTYNISVVYRGGRFTDGAAEPISERGAQGEGTTPDAGDVGAGGVRAEQLLGPSYEGRGDTGERGQRAAGDEGGTEPVTNANVDKVVSVKLTKAQLRRIEEAAGLRRMKLSSMQKRIARSRSAGETMSLTGKLMLMARNRDADVGLLTSLFNSIPPTVLQKLLGPLATEDVVRLGERAGMNAITRIDNIMRNEYLPYVNRIMQRVATLTDKWADFTSRSAEGAQALADVMFIANMYDVDPMLAPSAGEYIKQDATIAELTAKQAAEKDPKKKAALRAQITKRQGEIRRVYNGGQDTDGTEVLGWKDVPPAGKQLFRAVRDEYRSSFDEHYRLLMQRIDESGFDNEKAVELKSAVEQMFAKARERTIYFPLRRFGEYWVSVGKGKTGEFHMFESASEQDAFLARLRSEGEQRTVSSGYGRSTLRNMVGSGDASAALKTIMDLLDSGDVSDIELLKDHVFQMYLTALPEADMRRRFIHRQFKTGFSTDVLRTFATTSVAAANQLGRLAFNYKFDNAINEAYAETEENPSKRRLDTITREMELRVRGMLSPDPENSLDWWLSLGAKGTFLFLLSSPKSAIMNLTQLHIVGLPTLSAEFGEKATYGMAARYTGQLLTGKRIANPFRDAEGNVSLQIPNFTAENSAYIQGLQETDPDRYAAIMKAWQYAQEHDVTQSTFAAATDVYERGNKPTETYGFVQSVRRGELITAAQRATANTMNAMGALFHNMERIGREVAFMSAFELAYDRNLKQGMAPEAAGDAAMVQAANLTNDAMFDFSSWNKSRYSKAQAGRLALQMRSYSFAMTSLLFRSFVNMLPLMNKEGKMAAARVFFGVGAMTALYGGFRASQFYALAMLGYGLYEFVKSLPGDDEEEEDIAQGYISSETFDRELLKFADEKGNELSKKDMEFYTRSVWIPETFGSGGTIATALGIDDAAADKLATAADIGLPGVFGVDISNSVSLGDLWHPVTTKADDPEVQFFEVLGRIAMGPSGSLVVAPVKAVKEANAGNLDKAIEVSLPAIIRNYVKAERLQEEGLVVGKNRDVVLKDPSFYDTYTLAMQSLGFPEAQTSRAMQLDIQANEIEKEISDERTKLLDQRYRALRAMGESQSDKAEQEFKKVERAIEIYNLNYPSNAISSDTKARSFEEKSREAAEKMYGFGVNPDIPVRQPLVEERIKQFGP